MGIADHVGEVVTGGLTMGIACDLTGEVVTGDRFLENEWTKAGEIGL